MGSTWPPRPYGWRVHLASGATVDEFPDTGPPAHRWDALDHEAIERLELVSVGLVREAEPIVRWRLADGALWIRGRPVDVVLGAVQLTRSPGTLLDPVQKKKASSTYRPGRGATTRLHGFLVGCRRELEALEGAPVRVLAKVDPEGGVGLRIDAPDRLASDGVAIVVDGEMVHSRDRFRELIAPPRGGDAPCP